MNSMSPEAHPLGTFTINHDLRVEARYQVATTYCNGTVFTNEHTKAEDATLDYAAGLAAAIEPPPDMRRHIRMVTLVQFVRRDGEEVLGQLMDAGPFPCSHRE